MIGFTTSENVPMSVLLMQVADVVVFFSLFEALGVRLSRAWLRVYQWASLIAQ